MIRRCLLIPLALCLLASGAFAGAIAPRSAVVAPGDTVAIPIEMDGGVAGVYGFQMDLSSTPPAGGSLLRFDQADTGAAVSIASSVMAHPEPPTFATLRLGLSTEIPAPGDPRPFFDGPGVLAEVEILVPADAADGQQYSLELTEVLLAGPDNRALSVTVFPAVLFVGAATALADTLEAPAGLNVGEGLVQALTVRVLAGALPVPGVSLSFVSSAPQTAALDAASAVTGADGRASVSVTGIGFGNTSISVSAPGLGSAQVAVSVTGVSPVITSVPVTSLIRGRHYSYDVEAEDPQNDLITYSLDTAPAGMGIDPVSGLISWDPAPAQPAEGNNVTVRAADPGGNAALQAFAVLILTDADNDTYDSRVDCDDKDPDVNPGQAEIPYNGIDDDCNPLTTDDDLDGDGYAAPADCDDSLASVNPGATEILYNGRDDDCDPSTPDVLDADGDGYLSRQVPPLYTGPVDCDDNNPLAHPGGVEIPQNGVDDDCDPATPDNWSQGIVAIQDNGGRVYAATSNGDGGFENYHFIWKIGGYNCRGGIAAADFDNDNDLDIVAAGGSSDKVDFFWFENQGDNTFLCRTISASMEGLGSYAYDMTAADFNHDGYADIALNTATATVILGLGDGKGGFALSQLASTGDGRGLDAADINNDGHPDLIRGNEAGKVMFHLGVGDGTFGGPIVIADVGSNTYGLAVADFDGDTLADIIANNGYSGDPYLFKNNGDGSFTNLGKVASADGNNETGLDAYDYDNDGRADLVAVVDNDKSLYFYRGLGDGSFEERAQINPSATGNAVLGVSAPPYRVPGAPWAVAVPPEQDIAAGGQASFDGSPSHDPDGVITAFSWSFGDGSPDEAAETAQHTYNVPEGRYFAGLKVTDNNGRGDIAPSRVTVRENPPSADFTPLVFDEGFADKGAWLAVFDASASTDDAGIVSYEWDFGDGWTDDFLDGDFSGWEVVSGSWAIEDGALAQTNASSTLPLILYGPASAADFIFEADLAFQDSSYDRVRMVFRVADPDNFYCLELIGQSSDLLRLSRVTDGAFATLQEHGMGEDVTPGRAYHIKVQAQGELIKAWLDGHLAFWLEDDAHSRGRVGFSTYKTKASFDNVALSGPGSGQAPAHSYDQGSYEVRLAVMDAAGQSDSITRTVQILAGDPPLAEAGADIDLSEADAGLSGWAVFFDGRASTDDFGIFSYEWDFGDGSSGTGPQPAHIYEPAGFPAAYTVTLTVTDNALQTHSDTLQVTVDLSADTPPAADPGGPYAVDEESAHAGEWTVCLDASASTDDLGISRYAWDFGDGSEARFSYALAGSSWSRFGTLLYGVQVPGAKLIVTASQAETRVELVGLDTGELLAQRTLAAYEAWEPAGLSDDQPFKIWADKPVGALLTDKNAHMAFVPSIEGGPLGREFVFYYVQGDGVFLFAHEDTVIRTYGSGGGLLEEVALRAGEYHEMVQANKAVYRVVSTGLVSIQAGGANGVAAVPSENGDGAGQDFSCALAGADSALLVFALEAADVDAADLDSGAPVNSFSLAEGETRLLTALGAVRLSVRASGKIALWAAGGGEDLATLGDDTLFAGGEADTSFLFHGLSGGAMVFSPMDGNRVTADGQVYDLDADEFLTLAPDQLHELSSLGPVFVQVLAPAGGWASFGAWLGGAAKVCHRYQSAGDYTTTLTSIDQAGQEGTAQALVSVRDSDPPVAVSGGPYTVWEEHAVGGSWLVAFDAGASTDDYGIWRIVWDFDASDGITEEAEGANPTHHYAAPGVYTVTLRVYDHAGQMTEVQTTVTVLANELPAADAGGPYEFGEEIARDGIYYVPLDATGSTDDYGIYEYWWDLGDSVLEDFSASLENRDDLVIAGSVSTDGDTGTFTGAGSWGGTHLMLNREYARDGGNVFTASFYCATQSGSIAAFGLKNNRDGADTLDDLAYGIDLYITSFRIYEDGVGRGTKGNFSYNTWYEVKIELLPGAGARYWARKKDAGEEWKLLYETDYCSMATRFVPAFMTRSGTWKADDIGARRRGFGPEPVYGYESAGSWPLALTVVDNALQETAQATTVNLTVGAPPVADPGGPYAVEPYCMFAFDGTGSSDDVHIGSYEWDFGDGFTGQGPAPSHFYAQPGTYDVSLTVYDNLLQSHTETTQVTVAAGAPPAAEAGGPYTGGKNGPPVRFDGTASTDDCGIFSYAWTVTTLAEDFSEPEIYTPVYTYGTITGRLFPENGMLVMDKGTYSALTASWFRTSQPMEVEQGISLSGRLQVFADPGNITLGFKRPSAKEGLGQVVHGIRFYQNILRVVENGAEAGQFGNYTNDDWHSFRVELDGADARYYVDGVLIHESAVVYSGLVYPYLAANRGYHHIDDLKVTRSLDGARAQALFLHAGTSQAILTVADGAGQSFTDTAQVTIVDDMPPQVACVPWVGSDRLYPHETYNGKRIMLKGAVQDADPAFYQWDFGDGTTSPLMAVSEPWGLSATHTYPDWAEGTPFVATLTVWDQMGNTGTDHYNIIVKDKTIETEANVAIDQALWSLHLRRDRSGGDYHGGWSYLDYSAGPTAMAVQSFLVNAHTENQDPFTNPYVPTVRQGMDYLLRRLTATAISVQTYGDPDTNGNGLGISVNEDQHVYQGGMAMMALAATGTPLQAARGGGENLRGRIYRDILADMCDMYSYGQSDEDGNDRGGWRYNWNYGDSDNSVSQWAAMGYEAASESFAIKPPDWVKERNLLWLERTTGSGGIGYGYQDGTKTFTMVPAGMSQLSLWGTTPEDWPWLSAENYLASQWDDWYVDVINYYGLFGLAKAMRTAKPRERVIIAPDTSWPINWFKDPERGVARTVIDDQLPDGTFGTDGEGVTRTTGPFRDAFGVLILSPTLFTKPPVADAGLSRFYGTGVPLFLDGSRSFHMDPFRSIVLYEWDINGDGIFEYGSASPLASHVFSDLGEHIITLRVTDNNVPEKSATDTLTITVTDLPHPPVARSGGPYTATAGIARTLDGSASYDIDPGDGIFRYGWETDMAYPYAFDDQAGAAPSHTWAAPGTYHLALRVWDTGAGNDLNQNGQADEDERLFDTQWTQVVVSANQGPTAEAGGPYEVDEGRSLSGLLDGSGSRDPNGDPLTYSWDLDGDGAFDDADGVTGTGPDCTFSNQGNYVIRLRVSDTLLSDTDDAALTVRDLAPTARIAGDILLTQGQMGSFDAGASTSAPDAIVGYEWDWDYDGVFAASGDTGLIEEQAWADTGFYTVAVRVTDSDGSQDVAALLIQVRAQNNPPVADIGGPYAADEGMPLNLDASASTDPDNDPLTFAWDLDNDGLFDDAAGEALTYTWTRSGVYPVSVQVSDGQATDTASANVTINDLGPTAAFNFAPAVAELGQAIAFTDLSLSPQDAITAWAWSFGNEGVSAAQNPAFLFAAAGQHGVTLTVTDADGSTDSVSHTVTVHELICFLAGSAVLTEGSAGAWDAGASSTSAPFVITGYAWDWDYDGAFAASGDAGAATSHTYADDGAYCLAVLVSDSLGASCVQALTVTVQNAPPQVQVGPDAQVDEDAPCALSGSFTDAGVLDTHVIEWSFGDGGTAAGATDVMHTYADPGVYTATMTVTDDDGGQGRASCVVTVNKVWRPPVADIGGPYAADEGQPVTLDASGSTDPDNDPLTFAWDLDNDGLFGDAAGATVVHTWNRDGVYPVSVEVSDGHDTDRAAINVTINDLGPAAAFAANPAVAELGQAVAFTDLSTSPQDAITAWAWSFGNEGLSAAQNPAFTFAAAGPHGVTLTVTDADGSTDRVSHTVTVHSLTAALAGDNSLAEGGAGSYDASASAVSAPYAITGYEWDWNYDGAAFAPSGDTGVTASHTFPQDGLYQVAVRATDSLGAGQVATLAVAVQNAPPVVQPVPDPQPVQGQAVQFNGGFADPGILDTHVIEWAFGDGGTATGLLNPLHTYANPGSYTVTLKVTDNFGAFGDYSFPVQVAAANQAPAAHAGGPYVVDEGAALALSALLSTDPENDPLTFAWDLDNDGAFDDAAGARAVRTWNADGAYTVRVQVSDGALQSVAQANVTVNDLAPTAAIGLATSEPTECDPTSFTDLSTSPADAIVAWQWDFGGQGQSNARHPSFQFPGAGDYLVTLTVTDSDGSVSRAQVTVSVGGCKDCDTGSCFIDTLE